MPRESLFYHIVHNLCFPYDLLSVTQCVRSEKHTCYDKYCLWALKYPTSYISFVTVYNFKYLTGSCHRKRLTECVVLHSDIILAYFQRWIPWNLFKMRWCSTTIYNSQSTGQVEENKGIHHKEIRLLKEKKEKQHWYMHLCPQVQKQQQFCSSQTLNLSYS